MKFASLWMLGIFVMPGWVQAASLRAQIMSAMQKSLVSQSKGASHSHPRFFFAAIGVRDGNNSASRAHAFASFVRVTGDAQGDEDWSKTISWLPETYAKDLHICIGVYPFCQPVTGHNYTLDESLSFAVRLQSIVGTWGPYETTEKFYQEGLTRIAELESGEYKYLAADFPLRESGGPFNCLHAISDLAGEHPGYYGPFFGMWGVPGMVSMLEHFNDHGEEWLLKPIDPEVFKIYSYGVDY